MAAGKSGGGIVVSVGGHKPENVSTMEIAFQRT